MATPTRPPVARQSSRLPGGFDDDDELSPIKASFDVPESLARLKNTPGPGSEAGRDTGRAEIGAEEDSLVGGENDTFLQEKEMRRKLEDLDSTFLQSLSPVAPQRANTSSLGEEQSGDGFPDGSMSSKALETQHPRTVSEEDDDRTPASPATPPSMYKTPAPQREEARSDSRPSTAIADGHYNTSSLETMSSSPTAAAAARTVSRAVSMASMDQGYETADDSRTGGILLEHDSTPRKGGDHSDVGSRSNSPTPTKPPRRPRDGEDATSENDKEGDMGSPQSRKRPQHLQNRMSSQRSTYSSYTTTSTEGGSDITLGADFALQSGGAVPQRGSVMSARPTDFSRSISMFSMASGISGNSDSEDRILKPIDPDLSTLQEEDTLKAIQDSAVPQTPRSTNLNTPTDTVIAQHVKDVQVPATLAKEYRSRQRQASPERRAGAATPAATRNGKNLTLKEQSSTIDRLVKENFDLKLKITFLDEALNRRSDEGVKAMISENVDLRTAKFKSAKETRELKRAMRDLERRLKEKSDELSAKTNASVEDKSTDGPDMAAFQDMEDEVLYLRERVTTCTSEIERLHSESSMQEMEKKRLAEVVRRYGDSGRGTDVGTREEVALWKDLLEAETARREQADEDNRRLHDEIRRLKSDGSSTTTNNHNSNVYHVSRRQKLSSALSYNDGSEREFSANGASNTTSSTLVEQLRVENSELRREIGAQTSMLQSRNREKQHLQDQIEDLKLGARRGDGSRSVAGESIFERSASRAHGRPGSRSSDQTRMTQMSDPEREALEFKNGQLRDQNAKFRLEIQDLTKQMDQLLDEVESLDGLKIDYQKLQQLYDNDIAEATEDLQNLSRERDEALGLQEDMEQELQDLKAEGSEKIGGLEEDLEQRGREIHELQNELSNHSEDSEALRREVRTLSERIIRIEAEVEDKSKKIRSMQLELEELGHEADAMDKDLRDEKEKNSKLTVQQESSQGEIAFLREEQDGDKMKIGDLENALENLRNALTSEKDRAKELETRLADERHQREIIGSKEKQEVQKMMNDLNREVSSSKDESRKLKKNLQSREIEATTFKERLLELESHLKEVLGDPNGTRSTFLVAITNLQKDLDSTSNELETTLHNLSDKERLLNSRDALLESHGLESKKLSELLERERQGRRQDKAQHEQWQKTHQHTSRTVSQKDTRIVELESSRQSDRKKISVLEQQYKDQLTERNTLLLTLWTRITSLCGSEWQHQNSLINNHLPTIDVIANASMLPSFSKTLLSAVKTVENTIISFQSRIRTIEREVWTEYQSLEHTLDSRIKKLDRLEATVQSHRISGTFTAAPEIAKLRGENRLLKSEIVTLQKQELHSRNAARGTASRAGSTVDFPSSHGGTNGLAAPPPVLARHHSSSAVEHLSNANRSPISPSSRSGGSGAHPEPPPRYSSNSNTQSNDVVAGPVEPSQQRWIHRLRELERRLKAEREARLLDRSGARKRLEEGAEENKRLRGELEREKIRKGGELVLGRDDGEERPGDGE